MIRPALLAVAVAAFAVPVMAHEYKAGALKIGHPWTRPAAAGFNGAGYLTVTNTGATADTLLGAEADGVKSVSLHKSTMNGVMASMKSMPEGVVIAPGKTLALEPGGYHFMLVGLKSGAAAGGKLPLTLRFAKAGKIKVDLAVDAAPPSSEHKH